jgi:hypothetical protein
MVPHLWAGEDNPPLLTRSVFKYCIFLVLVDHLPITNEDDRGGSL